MAWRQSSPVNFPQDEKAHPRAKEKRRRAREPVNEADNHRNHGHYQHDYIEAIHLPPPLAGVAFLACNAGALSAPNL
jgi:hypothetical protein